MGSIVRLFKRKSDDRVEEPPVPYLPKHLERKLLGPQALQNGQRTSTSPIESRKSCSLCSKAVYPSRCTSTVSEFRKRASNGCLGCTLILSAHERAFRRHHRSIPPGTSGPASKNTEIFRVTASIRDHRPNNLFIDLSSSGSYLSEEFSIFATTAPALCSLQLPRFNICSDNSGSHGCFETITKWIKACDSHPACMLQGVDQSLPTRILDVGSGKINLCPGSKASGPYCALSHCWGRRHLLRTTRENLDAHRLGIEENCLSKSFRDAILLTRHLKIRYIWIDSLCIIQDDHDDWKRESVKMASVYEGAYLVIAATGAEHGGIGCFTERKTSISTLAFEVPLANGLATPVYIYKQPEHKSFVTLRGDYGDTPLLKRAWVFQERILSRRVIHFAANELVWECRTHAKCECGYIEAWDTSRYLKTQCALEGDPDKLLVMWYNLLAAYTALDLTKTSDRLPAILGLVKHLQARGCGDHVAGLWVQDIFRGLLWSVDSQYSQESRGIGWRAPSWSWASIEGTKFVTDRVISSEKLKSYGKTPTGKDFCTRLVSIDQYTCNVDQSVDSTGVIAAVSLTLATPVIPISVVHLSNKDERWTIRSRDQKFKYLGEVIVRFDCPKDDFNSVEITTILAWIGTSWVAMGPDDEFDCEYATYYLIMQPSRGLSGRPPSRGCYERVGIVIDCDRSLVDWFDDAEIQTITIV